MLRSQLSLPLVALVLLIGAEMPGTVEARTFSSAGTISVTAGLPHELSFRLSPSRITSSTELFRVTNRGKQPHSFKLCTTPTPNDKANTCAGVATKVLAPGATATVKVTLAASGTYEYLSASASQAAAGMKGLVTVTLTGAPGSSSSSTSGSGSTPTTTTTSSSGGGTGGGGVVNGAATDPACAAGTTVPVGPNTGDEDDDNEGGFPSDGDGCV